MNIKFEVFGDVVEAGGSCMVHFRPVELKGTPLFPKASGEFIQHFPVSQAEKFKAGQVVELDLPQFDPVPAAEVEAPKV